MLSSLRIFFYSFYFFSIYGLTRSDLKYFFSQVAVRNKRLRDTPGVKLTCMRGMYDLPHVVKKTN